MLFQSGAKSYFKIGQLPQDFISKCSKRYFKVDERLFQSGAKVISKWDKMLFQRGAVISKWNNYFQSGA